MLCCRKDFAAVDVDIQNSGIQHFLAGQTHRHVQFAHRADHNAAKTLQGFLQEHRDQHLIFHHQDPAAGQAIVRGLATHHFPLSLRTSSISLVKGMAILQRRPSGRNARVTSASSSSARPRSMRLVPNPRRVGSVTAGPPVSVQVSVNESWSPERVTVHATVRQPEVVASEPYLVALLANSWTAIAKAIPALGVRETSQPSTTMLPVPRS